MRKEILIRLGLMILLFVLITVFKQYFSLMHWPFWLGGIIGTFLPDIDHLLYVYIFKPLDMTSQRAIYYFKEKQYSQGLQFLYETRGERTDLIFHTLNFVIIFGILTFWVMSSSGSLFGQGLVLSFWLHLTIDYYRIYKLQTITVGMIALLLISGILL